MIPEWTQKFQSSKHFEKMTWCPSPRLAPVLKIIFHQCVILYTNSDGSVLKPPENRAIIVGLDPCIWNDTLMKKCFKDWSQSIHLHIPQSNYAYGHYMNQCKRLLRLSHWWAAKALKSLRICTDSPEPSLLAYTKYGSRWRHHQSCWSGG